MTTPEQRDALSQLGRALTAVGPALAPVGSNDLLRSITEAARELFGAAACSLALLSDDQSELVFTTASGTGAADVVDLRLPVGQGIAGWVVMSEQPISVSDLQNDSRFDSDVARSTGYVPDAILAVPVASRQRLLGVIEVLDRDDRRPGAEHDMRLLALFADQAAIAIEGARVFDDLGSAVLRALADARPGADVADALADAAAAVDEHAPQSELLQLAALFAELERAGSAERELAVRLVEDVLRYLRGRDRRRV